MIEKKRLEELIEQGATIWGVYDYSYSTNKPNKKVEQINLDEFCHYYKDIDEFIMFQGDSMFFETEEEAEWHKEFGCIERTERLELPTWEEFKNDGEFSFLDKQGFEWDLYSPDDETRISLVGGYDHYEFDYTKENYTLACRKAKELFLGEKK